MTSAPSIEQDIKNLDLEPAKPDMLSVKTQIVLAAILAAIVSFAIYAPTIAIGFLHDDFLHLDYVARAVLKGDTHDFLANFYSNWGGSDLMRSYRPLVSLSIFTDFLFFNTHAAGYHVTNILLVCVCALFVGLIASEISGAYGNRMRAVTAIWAALLFAAYPLHVESVAWIIGRVDLLCTLFYLASLYYFLRLRLIEEKPYIWLSLGCFLLSLVSKEMAVTLPAVATVFALLVPSRLDNSMQEANRYLVKNIIRRPTKLEWQALGGLWGLLAVFAILRTLLLGDAVGGYGGSGLSLILSSFANKGALLKIIVPANEEVIPLSKQLISIGSIVYLGAFVFAALRCLVTPSLIRCFVALALFGGIALLPTFQVWNIAPNLCGSRLFFLSSAALAIGIALAFVPSEDSIDKRSTKVVSAVGAVFLAFTLVLFCYLAHKNVSTFVEAGARVKRLKQELIGIAKSNPQSTKFLLLNIPSDYRGAPMLTRPQYLKIMASPPFSDIDAASELICDEMDLPCDHSIYSAKKAGAAAANAVEQKYLWSDAEGKVLPLKSSSGKAGFSIDLFNELAQCTVSPDSARKVDGTAWNVTDSHEPRIVNLADSMRLYPGNHGIAVTRNGQGVDPIKTSRVRIRMSISANQPVENLVPLVQFIWEQEQAVVSKNKSASLVKTGENEFECDLSNNKEWLLGGEVKAVGLSLKPAPYYVTIRSIEGIPALASPMTQVK